MAARKHELKADSRGIRPRIGYVAGTKSQPRFNLGKDVQAAELLYALIHQLYDENLRWIRKMNRRFRWGVDECWWPQNLEFAHQIAGGTLRVELPFIPTETPDAYVQRYREKQADFPSLNLIPFDESFYFEGVRILEQYERDAIDGLYRSMKRDGFIDGGSKVPSRIIDGSLHVALDAYIKHIEEEGGKVDEVNLVASQRKRVRIAKSLKRHDDYPLTNLTPDCVQKLIAFWRNRPPTEKTDRASKWYSNSSHRRFSINPHSRRWRKSWV